MEFIKDPVLGQYFIQVDDYNYSVFKTIMPDSGTPYDSCLGHFGNFGSALKRIVENKVRQQSYSSIVEYVKEYKEITQEFNETFSIS